MIATLSLLLSSVAFSFASPLGQLEARTVTALNTAAFEQAQQRDDTATRAFSGTEIIVCFLPQRKLLLINRPQPGNASSSMSYQGTFVQT